MKKYLLFLCVFVILGACTNIIGYLPDDEPKKLIVNAMMLIVSAKRYHHSA